MLVFNEETNIGVLREYLQDCFDAEISDIKVSAQGNTYQYTVLFEERSTQIGKDASLDCKVLTSVNLPNGKVGVSYPFPDHTKIEYK